MSTPNPARLTPEEILVLAKNKEIERKLRERLERELEDAED